VARGRPSRETIFDRFATALDELAGFGSLPKPAEAGAIWDDIWHLEAHNSTAIEGNTLVLREVEQLLDAGKAVGAKPLKDYLEVLGYGDAASGCTPKTAEQAATSEWRWSLSPRSVRHIGARSTRSGQ